MKEVDRLRLLRVDGARVGARSESKPKRKRSITTQISRVAPGTFAEKLLQAGIYFSPEVYSSIVLAISVCAGGVAFRLGPFLSLFLTASISYYLFVLYLEERAEKRRKNVLPQLPSFIDALASAIGTGYNLEAAIIHAAESVPEGLLRDEMNRVVSALRRGMSITESIGILTHRIQGKEIISLAVAIYLFHGMGGRVLEPFKRLAKKVREQQAVLMRAKRDLVQVRQAFRILFYLSILAPVVLLIVQPDYLGKAFDDSLGRVLIQFALMLEVTALLLFKKVTAIKI